MDVLKKYIQEKEEKLKYKTPNKSMIHEIKHSIDKEESFLFYSRVLNEKILFLVNKKNALKFIYEELRYSKVQKDYIDKMMSLFDKYFAYVEKNRINFIKKYDKKKNKIFFSLDKININDVYIFISNYYYNNSKIKSKNYVLSRMRKYIRLLNDEPNLNYNYKIEFKNKKPKIILTSLEEILLIKFLKEKEDLQPLLLFYFLYYLGMTFSTISRIKITDFRNSLHLLKIKKGKIKNYKIIEIIVKIIYEFIMNKTNITKYLFYDGFVDTKKMTRVNYIKKNFSNILKDYDKFSLEQIEILMKYFTKSRAPKKLATSFMLVFDKDIEIDEDFIKSELDEFPNIDEIFFSSHCMNLCENNEKNINANLVDYAHEKIFTGNTCSKVEYTNNEKKNNNLAIGNKDLIDFFNKRGYDINLNKEGFFKTQTEENGLDNLISNFNNDY